MKKFVVAAVTAAAIALPAAAFSAAPAMASETGTAGPACAALVNGAMLPSIVNNYPSNSVTSQVFDLSGTPIGSLFSGEKIQASALTTITNGGSDGCRPSRIAGAPAAWTSGDTSNVSATDGFVGVTLPNGKKGLAEAVEVSNLPDSSTFSFDGMVSSNPSSNTQVFEAPNGNADIFNPVADSWADTGAGGRNFDITVLRDVPADLNNQVQGPVDIESSGGGSASFAAVQLPGGKVGFVEIGTAEGDAVSVDPTSASPADIEKNQPVFGTRYTIYGGPGTSDGPETYAQAQANGDLNALTGSGSGTTDSGSGAQPSDTPTDSSSDGTVTSSSSGSSGNGSGQKGITAAHAQSVLGDVAKGEKVWHLEHKSYGKLNALGSPDPSMQIGMNADADGFCAATTDQEGTTWYVSEQATTATSTMPNTAAAKGCPPAPKPTAKPKPTTKAKASHNVAKSAEQKSAATFLGLPWAPLAGGIAAVIAVLIGAYAWFSRKASRAADNHGDGSED